MNDTVSETGGRIKPRVRVEGGKKGGKREGSEGEEGATHRKEGSCRVAV